jgi:hypothetical protein
VVTRDVPDYAMVHGNPGRLRGWMCHCGVKLDLGLSNETTEIAECPSCSRGYRKEGLRVSECTRTLLDGDFYQAKACPAGSTAP